VNRGEVWWVDDPQAGRRPHVVLTREAAIPVLHSVIAAPATTTIRGLPTVVEIGVEDGMPRACVLSLDNVTLLPKAFFREWICRLSSERMQQVCKALVLATGCA
jgi:mRNA interferase MazF